MQGDLDRPPLDQHCEQTLQSTRAAKMRLVSLLGRFSKLHQSQKLIRIKNIITYLWILLDSQVKDLKTANQEILWLTLEVDTPRFRSNSPFLAEMRDS